MTAIQIITHVKSTAVDDQWGPTETKDLVRYFVATYCKWLSHENIAEMTGTTQATVSRSVSKVKNDAKFKFIVRRLTKELNELIPKLHNAKPILKWTCDERELKRQRLLEN